MNGYSPSGIAGSVNLGVGIAHLKGDNGGFGLGLVIVACDEVGGGDGVEIALRSVRSGDGGAGSGQSSGDGDDLHFDCLKEDLSLLDSMEVVQLDIDLPRGC